MGWRYRHTVLALCTLAFFLTFFGRMAVSPLVPFVTDAFGVSNAAVGLALSGMWLAYGLSQFPSGALSDRFGEKRVIAVAVGGTALTSLLIAAAPHFSLFVLATFLLGAVAGLHYSVATTLLSRSYEDLGTAVGVHSVGAPLSGLVAPVAAAWVAVRYGWRPAVALTALVAVPVFALFVAGVRPTEPRNPDRRLRELLSADAAGAVLGRPPVAFTLAVAVGATFAVQGLLSFLPTFLVDHHGYSPTLAGALFSGLFVVKGAANLPVGAVSDRAGRDAALGGCLLLFGAGYVLLVVAPGLQAVGAGILLVGVGSSLFPALDPRFIDRLPGTDRGYGFGLVRTVYGVLGATGPVVVGAVADLASWATAFSGLAALCLVLVLTLVANRALGLGY